jgi:CheY-like chemotaxis protein
VFVANESGSMFSLVQQYASRWKSAAPASTTNVLIVDDEEPICRFVERVLRDAGYKTFVANSGAEAVEVASKLASLDVLVTDVMMPKMMGDEVARRLRQDRPGLKVLYLTGYSDSLFKEKVTLWEDEAYLDKPCTIKSLLQAVSLLFFGSLETPAQLKAVAPAEN